MLAYQFATMGSLHNILHGVYMSPFRPVPFNVHSISRTPDDDLLLLQRKLFCCREERSSGRRARAGPELDAASEDSLRRGERAGVPPRESPAVDRPSRHPVQQRSYLRRVQLQDCGFQPDQPGDGHRCPVALHSCARDVWVPCPRVRARQNVSFILICFCGISLTTVLRLASGSFFSSSYSGTL